MWLATALVRFRLDRDSWCASIPTRTWVAADECRAFGRELWPAFRTELFSRPGVRGFFRPRGNETPRGDPHIPDAGACRRHAVPLRSRPSPSVHRWSAGARGLARYLLLRAYSRT